MIELVHRRPSTAYGKGSDLCGGSAVLRMLLGSLRNAPLTRRTLSN